MNQIGFKEWMAQQQHRTESALENLLPSGTLIPQRLHDAMRYAALGGGKRIRPLLIFATGELAGGLASTLDTVACAVECIHVYSLVHDDMPCMDNDNLRRGKPTVHVQYDEATALLVGDALQTQAFDLLSGQDLFPDAKRQIRAMHVLAQASGSRGMAGGQAIDLNSVGQQLSREELEHMHLHKTGALIRAAVLLGALAGKADEAVLEALDRYAKQIGLLFQVVDDVLDTVADTATLGKTAGKDAANNKPTYVSILGLNESKQLANDLAQSALDAVAGLGESAQRLREIALYIVNRQF